MCAWCLVGGVFVLVSDNGGGVGGFSASVGWMVFGRGGSASAISGVQQFRKLWRSITVDGSEYYLFI